MTTTHIRPLADTTRLGHHGHDVDVVNSAHRVYEHLISLWAPGTIEAAHDLGVFDLLATGPADAPSVAQSLGTDLDATEVLLEALFAYDIVTRTATDGWAIFTLPDAVRDCLLPGGLYSLAGKVGYDRRLAWDAWRHLADAVRTGKRDATGTEQVNQISEHDYAHLVRGINFWAPPVVETLSRELVSHGWPTLRGTSMIDIGCGSGLYSHLLMQRFGQLKATGVDVPQILEIANEHAQRLGVDDRFSARSGDFTTDDFGSGYDLALLVNIYHLQTDESARDLTMRVSKLVSDNGLVAIVDHIIDDSRGAESTHNRFFRLFAASMLATGGGKSYRLEDYDSWLEHAGLRRVSLVETPMHRILLAKRS